MMQKYFCLLEVICLPRWKGKPATEFFAGVDSYRELSIGCHLTLFPSELTNGLTPGKFSYYN